MTKPGNKSTTRKAEVPQYPHNRCFIYPQGQASILPQLTTLMAAVASLFAWPWLGISFYFACVEYSTRSGGTRDEGSLCYPLELVNPEYWNNPDTSGWAAAIQAAAIFAIFSSILGFMAFALLSTATCFELTLRKILIIVIMQGLAAFLAILSLVGGAANACEANGLSSSASSCTRDGMRVETGAGFEIFAFLLYLMALGFTLWWYFHLRRETLPKEETKALVQHSVPPSNITNTSTIPTERRTENQHQPTSQRPTYDDDDDDYLRQSVPSPRSVPSGQAQRTRDFADDKEDYYEDRRRYSRRDAKETDGEYYHPNHHDPYGQA